MIATAFDKRERVSGLRLAALDGVRGAAILAVLLVHSVTILVPDTLPFWLVKPLSSLWIGVNVFFVLSGFLITGILFDTKHDPHYFKSFYMRRVLRIFPLYYGTLVGIFFVLPALKMAPSISASQQFWYWTYLGNWANARNLNVGSLGHFWSLAVEEQFYLVWPLVIYLLPRRSVSAGCCAGIAASFSYRTALFLLNHPVREAYFGTPARVEDLAIGALAAWIIREPDWLKKILHYTKHIAAFSIAALAVVCIAARGFESWKQLPVVFGTTPVSLLSGLVVLSVASSAGGISKNGLHLKNALSLNWLRWLGTYSYGIYVFHAPIMRWAHEHLTGNIVQSSLQLTASVFLVVATIALTCGMAFLSYQTYEKQFLTLKSRFQAVGHFTNSNKLNEKTKLLHRRSASVRDYDAVSSSGPAPGCLHK